MFLVNYDGLSEELVEPLISRLIDKNALVAYRHDGVWPAWIPSTTSSGWSRGLPVGGLEAGAGFGRRARGRGISS